MDLYGYSQFPFIWINLIACFLQRGLHQLQQLHQTANPDENDQQKNRAFPLMIQGLRTNPKDPEGHILFFDIEALIGKYIICACVREGISTAVVKGF